MIQQQKCHGTTGPPSCTKWIPNSINISTWDKMAVILNKTFWHNLEHNYVPITRDRNVSHIVHNAIVHLTDSWPNVKLYNSKVLI